MSNSLVLNVGHKAHGYRKIFERIEELPTEVVEKIKNNKFEKVVKVLIKGIGVVQIAVIALDMFAGTGMAAPAVAAMAPVVNLDPLNTFQHELWLLMLRGILYVAVPVYGWCGYVLAFAGQNAGKRTAAKWLAGSMTGGIAFVAGAPWAADTVYKFFRGIFHV
jgi:hypothetical protein